MTERITFRSEGLELAGMRAAATDAEPYVTEVARFLRQNG